MIVNVTTRIAKTTAGLMVEYAKFSPAKGYDALVAAQSRTLSRLSQDIADKSRVFDGSAG